MQVPELKSPDLNTLKVQAYLFDMIQNLPGSNYDRVYLPVKQFCKFFTYSPANAISQICNVLSSLRDGPTVIPVYDHNGTAQTISFDSIISRYEILGETDKPELNWKAVVYPRREVVEQILSTPHAIIPSLIHSPWLQTRCGFWLSQLICHSMKYSYPCSFSLSTICSVLFVKAPADPSQMQIFRNEIVGKAVCDINTYSSWFSINSPRIVKLPRQKTYTIAFTAAVRSISQVVAQEVSAVLGGGGRDMDIGWNRLAPVTGAGKEQADQDGAELAITGPADMTYNSDASCTAGHRDDPQISTGLLAAVKSHPEYTVLRDRILAELPECGSGRVDQIANAVCSIVMEINKSN